MQSEYTQRGFISSCNPLRRTAVPMQRRVSAAAMIVKLLIYWRHAEWLGDSENISLLLTMLSPVLSTKVLEKEGETRRDSLLVIVLSPVLSLALYSWFCLLICSCHKFLAVLGRPFTCTSAPKGCKPYAGLTFCRRVSGGHNRRVWGNTVIFISVTHPVHAILIVV